MLIRAAGAGLALRANRPQAEKKETQKFKLSNCFFAFWRKWGMAWARNTALRGSATIFSF